MNPDNVAVLIPIVAIVGGITFAIVSVISKSKTRQLEIQQRIAMIEKGLVPPPETDPLGFERAMSWTEGRRREAPFGRHRRVGITLMGVGFGFMLLMGFTGRVSSSRGLGVGGFIVALGLAFLINSLLERRDRIPLPPASSGSTEPPPQPPTGS